MSGIVPADLGGLGGLLPAEARRDATVRKETATLPACSARPSRTSSSSSRSCPGSAGAPRSGSHSTSSRRRAEEALELSRAIEDVKARVRFCRECGNLTEEELCEVCADARRDRSVICVVEQPVDVISVERTHEFRGPLPRARRGAVTDRRRRSLGPAHRRAPRRGSRTASSKRSCSRRTRR